MLGEERRHDALGVVELDELLLPILDVEADHQVGVLERLLVHRQAQRVLVREIERVVDVPDRGAGGLGQLDDVLEAAGAPAGVFGEQHRMLGLEQFVGDGGDSLGSGIIGDGVATALAGGSSTAAGQRRFLQRRVVAHVNRALRLGGHDRIGAGK